VTSHKQAPRRRAQATPRRLALYAVLAVVVGVLLMFVMPPQWAPVIAVASLVVCGLYVRAAIRENARAGAEP
jgi:hypothetical protein